MQQAVRLLPGNVDMDPFRCRHGKARRKNAAQLGADASDGCPHEASQRLPRMSFRLWTARKPSRRNLLFRRLAIEVFTVGLCLGSSVVDDTVAMDVHDLFVAKPGFSRSLVASLGRIVPELRGCATSLR
jgi:hypothetical protein